MAEKLFSLEVIMKVAADGCQGGGSCVFGAVIVNY